MVHAFVWRSLCLSLGAPWGTEIVKTTSSLKRLTVWWTRQTFTQTATLDVTSAIVKICTKCQGPGKEVNLLGGGKDAKGAATHGRAGGSCTSCICGRPGYRVQKPSEGRKHWQRKQRKATGRTRWRRVPGERRGEKKYNRWKIQDVVDAVEQTYYWGKGVAEGGT